MTNDTVKTTEEAPKIPYLLDNIHDIIQELEKQQSVTYEKSLILGDFREEKKSRETPLPIEPINIIVKLSIIQGDLQRLLENMSQTNSYLQKSIG